MHALPGLDGPRPWEVGSESTGEEQDLSDLYGLLHGIYSRTCCVRGGRVEVESESTGAEQDLSDITHALESVKPQQR